MTPATRVRLFTSAFPQRAGDPAGGFIAALSVALVARGHSVHVESASGAWAPPGVVVRGPRAGGSALYAAGSAAERLALGGVRAWLAAGRAQAALTARGWACRGRSDVTVGHWLVPSGPAALAAGGRVVLYAHGSDVALLERLPMGGSFARALDAGAQVVAPVSEDLARRWCALLGRAPRAQVRVAPMGVSPPAPDAHALSALLTQPLRPHSIVTVGRLVRQKGLDVLLTALVGRDDVTWLAAGDGPERSRLQARATTLGVDLRLLGALTPRPRDALLASATLFVLPSRVVERRAEGAPVALREALASGVPCVASAVGGVPEQAPEPALTLVPPDQPAALRAAIDALLDVPTRHAEAAAAARDVGEAMLWPRAVTHHLRVMGLESGS
jgi:glycosyltransferase involved in cell wall biosynthesis